MTITNPAPPPSDSAPANAPPSDSPHADAPASSLADYATRLIDWFDSHWSGLVIWLLAAAVFALVIYGARALIRRRRRAAADMTLPDIFLNALGRTRSPAIWIFSLAVTTGLADLPSRVGGLFTLLLTAVVTLQGAAWARDIVLGLVQRQASQSGSETLTNSLAIIRVLISVALFAIASVIILDNVGVNVSALIAGLGIGGIAIGLAAQGIFADLFAALSIIFDRPFGKGDTIRYDNSFATVEKIGLKSTRLRSISGELLIISNTNLLNKEIANFARIERRRVNLAIGVIYQTSPDALNALPALMERVVADHGHVFVRASFTGFGDSSLDFELVFDVMSDDVNVVAAARTAVGVALFAAMHDAGYDFAYPTQTTFTAAPDGRMILPYPQGGWGGPATAPAAGSGD